MVKKIIKTTFKLKRGTSAQWMATNPILSDGEPGFELDTYKLKIGDGLTAWKKLPYIVDIEAIREDLDLDTISFEKIKSLFEEDKTNGI